MVRDVFLACLCELVLILSEARAQTACPVGSAAGNAVCGPDAITGREGAAEASRPTTYVRYPGYGAVAVSRSLSKASYFLDAGDEIASTVRDGALASCRNDGATDCQLLHEWINACVAVGSVPVDGVKQILSARRAPSELQNDKPDQSVPGVILKVSVACRMRIAQNRGVVTSRIEYPSLNSRGGICSVSVCSSCR